MDEEYLKLIDKLELLIDKNLKLTDLETREYLEFVENFCAEAILFEKIKSCVLLEFSRVSPNRSIIKRQWIIDAVINNNFEDIVLATNENPVSVEKEFCVVPCNKVANNSEKVTEVWIPIAKKN